MVGVFLSGIGDVGAVVDRTSIGRISGIAKAVTIQVSTIIAGITYPVLICVGLIRIGCRNTVVTSIRYPVVVVVSAQTIYGSRRAWQRQGRSTA
jgi:hypothetical protein